MIKNGESSSSYFPSPRRTVIILSGGMDSGVLLADCRNRGFDLLAVSFDYGAKHGAKELPCAAAICSRYEVTHQLIDLKFLKSILSSSLLQGGEPVPDGRYDEVNMRSTVVPFRNGIMLALAVGMAENLGWDAVFLGSHAGDRAVYPDCRTEFTEAISAAATEGTYSRVKVYSPYNKLTKSEIGAVGRKLSFDFSLSWSCYKGEELHCGTCAACHERKLALSHGAGLDPTVYRS